MNWLFEQPLIIVVLGVAIIFALGAVWSATGRKELLYGIAGAFLLLMIGLVVERQTITDREAIRLTLQQIAKDVQSNNKNAVAGHIHSTAKDLQVKAAAELPNYDFTECRVTRIHSVDIDDRAEPKSAIVEFNVIASGTFQGPGFEVTDTVPRWVQLHFLKDQDGRWKVVEYQHDSPERMIMNGSGGSPGR